MSSGGNVCSRPDECSHLCRAENRLLGLRRTGPWGSMVPLSFTQCRYPLVMSAIPIARAEQYMNL